MHTHTHHSCTIIIAVIWRIAGGVDKLFGTGMTDEGWWLQLQEYLLRLSTKKQGREAEAIEIIRKVGPFPNQSNRLKGSYVPSGTNRLKMIFKEFTTDEGKDMKVRGDKEELVRGSGI